MADNPATFKIKTLGTAVAVVLIAAAGLMIFGGNLVKKDFKQVGETWNAHIVGPAGKMALLSDLRGALGYDGMIHHFKNFVLRKDRRLIPRVDDSFVKATLAMNAYLSLGVTKREKSALDVLDRRLAKYRSALVVAEKMAAAGRTAEEIDKAVRIDDTQAVKAMRILDDELFAANKKSSARVSGFIARAERTSIAAAVIAALILVSIISVILWFLRIRLLRPLDALGGMMIRLAKGDTSIAVPGTGRKDEIGDMARSVAIFRATMAERKDIEEALVEAKERAVLADQAKSDFLANMSHELRTPLNAVIGFSEIIKTEAFGPVENPKYAEYVESIYDSGQLLLYLVNDLLDVTAIESGKLALREAEIDLNQAVADCFHQLEPQAGKEKIVLKNLITDKVPKVLADGLRLRQIILNLASNAVKFSPENGAVTIAAHRNAEGEMILSVTDTGIGMAAENISTALAPFGQVDGDAFTTSKGGGAGLGLFLCRLFAEMHGGGLEIESAPGIGTRALVRLPAWRVISEEKNEDVKGAAV
jgi:signal transduction histidine kinase